MSNESRQDWLRAISPTNLRYLTALRGFIPADQSLGFTYAMLGCQSGALLVALAAANPDGQFFGFGSDEAALTESGAQAVACGVDNVKFVVASLDELTSALPAQFDFVVANLIAATELDAAQVARTAGTLLREGGLCYMAYGVTPHGDQTVDAYLLNYQAGASSTDKAQAAARDAGFDFVGSAKLRNNYLELAAPSETHEAILAQQGAAVYENLKDVAMGLSQGLGQRGEAGVRHDVFAKPGLDQSDNDAARFGSFLFALPTPASAIAPQFAYFGKTLDLATPLYARLLAALGDMPHAIGDLIADEAFAGIPQDELVRSVQLLCAAGIVEPARHGGRLPQGNMDHLQFVGDYNRRLRDETVGEDGSLLASQTLGRALLGSAPMVMTLQALDAGGLKGAEDILDQMLQTAAPNVQAQIPADLSNSDTRRNTAYRLLEQACKDWLLFCCTNGILAPKAASS